MVEKIIHITINNPGSTFNYFGAGGPPATCKKAGGKTGGAYFTSCDPRSAFFQLPLVPDAATALLDRMRARSRIRTGFGSLH